jgi:hypothetical protein
MNVKASVLCAMVAFTAALANSQQPAPAVPPPAAPPPPAQAPSTNPPASSQAKPIPSFLIVGTVFNEQAMSFPGVQVRIRRADERKFRWETYTNSRGEFAVRVFPGYEYEVIAHVKKYQDQSATVNAKADVQERLSIKLQPAGQRGGETKP